MATRDYTLGRGKVLFKPTGQDAFVDLGNAPAFNISLTIDKLEHLSSRSGLSLKDLEVITKMGIGGSFTLDEPNAENLRMFVMATEAVASSQVGNGALTAADNVVLPAANALGKWYPLTLSSGGGVTLSAVTPGVTNTGTAAVTAAIGTYTSTNDYTYYIRVVTAGTEGAATVQTRRNDETTWCTPFTVGLADNPVKLAAGTDTLLNFNIDDVDLLDAFDEFSFVANYTAASTTRLYNIETTATPTDSVTVTVSAQGMVEGIEGVGNYQVDRSAGLLYINLDQTSPANPIADGDTLVIEVKTIDGSKRTSSGATQTSIKGDLYFVGAPPQGRIIDIQGFCSLTPNGDFSLIGTDWMQMQFNVEFLEVAGVPGLIKVEDRGKMDV